SAHPVGLRRRRELPRAGSLQANLLRPSFDALYEEVRGGIRGRLGLALFQTGEDLLYEPGGQRLLAARGGDHSLELSTELRLLGTGRASGQVLVDHGAKTRFDLPVEESLDPTEGLLALGSAVTHRSILAPWPRRTTPAR